MINDKLIPLIQSLSSSEKTTFKRYASIKSERKVLSYVVLFDIYNRLLKKSYSESEWENKFDIALKKHSNIQKDLANVKKRLKEKILESLLSEQTGKNKQMHSSLFINVLSILFERKLYSEMQSRINQLKKQAVTNEWYQHMVEIIIWEIRLLLTGNEKDDIDKMKELCDLQKHYLHLYNMEIQLQIIFQKMKAILERDLHLRKAESREALEKLGKEQLLLDLPIEKYESEKTFRIVLWFYRIKSVFYRWTGEFQQAYKYSKKLVMFFESDKRIKKVFDCEYISILCGLTKSCFRLSKNTELEVTLDKIKSIYISKNNFDALSATCDMGVPLYINTMQYDKAKELAEVLFKRWDSVKLKLNEGKLLVYIYHNFLLYWILNDEEKLNVWTSEALNYSRSNKSKEIYFTIKILNLTYNYDNGHFTYFKEKIETLKKTINNNNQMTPFEELVLKYLNKLLNIEIGKNAINVNNSEKQNLIKKTFEELKLNLENLINSKMKNAPNGYNEILIWIESRIQQKSIQEVYEDFRLQNT